MKITESFQNAYLSVLREAEMPSTVDGKPSRTTSGTLIHPTEEGVKNFWKWFDGSKTVQDGKPIVFYHATPEDFKKFEVGGKKIPQNGRMLMMSGPAMWFTPYKQRQDAAHNISAGPKSKAEGMPFKTGVNVMPVFLKIVRPLLIDTEGMLEWVRDVFADGSGEFPQLISQKTRDEILKDYDGIIYDIGEKVDAEYIVFNPNQIKSAIGNNGDFSGTSDLITEETNLNSLGKPISKSDTSVQNFWKWFGKSKVTDDQGRPLVLYHGTSKDVDFKDFKIGPRGAWFTLDRDEANTYASQNDSQKTVYDPDSRKWIDKNTAARVIPVYLKVENPYEITDADFEAMNKQNYAAAQKNLFAGIFAKGHDGIVFPGGRVWVALASPTQIKSAIGNKGTFSQTSKKINEQDGDGEEDTVIGFHYSKVPNLKELDASKYGTGTRGAEFRRVENSGDPRLLKRVYFYLQSEPDVLPSAESVVTGNHVYKAELKNIYNASEDPEGIIKNRDRSIDMESAILDAGYDGYYNTKFAGKAQGGAIVVLGKDFVPVEYVGTRTEASKLYPGKEGVSSGETTVAKEKTVPILDFKKTSDGYESGILGTDDTVFVIKNRAELIEKFSTYPLRFGRVYFENESDVEEFKEWYKEKTGFNEDVFHGTPHRFEPDPQNPYGKFSTSRIGTGEGNQAYGHGLYFSSSREVAEWYRKVLSKAHWTYDGVKIYSIATLNDLSGYNVGDNRPDISYYDEIYAPQVAPYILNFVEKPGKVTRVHINKSLKNIDRAIESTRKNIEQYPPALKKIKEKDEKLILAYQAVAEFIKKYIDPKKFVFKGGYLYHVEIPEEEDYLLWDKPLSENPRKIQDALADDQYLKAYVDKSNASKEALNKKYPERLTHPILSKFAKKIQSVDSLRGKVIYESLTSHFRNPELTSNYLLSLGILGIKYMGERHFNYVVFDDSKINIKKVEA